MANFGTTVSPEVLVENSTGVVAGTNVPDRPAAGTVMKVRDYETAALLTDVPLSTGGHWSTTEATAPRAVQVSFDGGTTWSAPVYSDTMRADLVAIDAAWAAGTLGNGPALAAVNALATRVTALEAGGGGGGGTSLTANNLDAVLDVTNGISGSVVTSAGTDVYQAGLVMPLTSIPWVHPCPSGLVVRPATTQPVWWVIRAVDRASLGSAGTEAGGTTATVPNKDFVFEIQ
jgi:hypothetical protein